MYFITSIEKEFFNSRNIEFTHQNKSIQNFKCSEIYSEEIQMNDKTYLNKLNCISFDFTENISIKKYYDYSFNHDILNINNVNGKIKIISY